MVVFCSECGHENPTGANFCSSCGAALPGEHETTVSFVPVETTAEPNDEPLYLAVDAAGDGVGTLVVRRGPEAGTTYTLDREVTRVGRHPESEIFLDDITVSRRHAEFVRQPNGYLLKDAGSLNGTYVNRERIEETLLENGDEVQIGKFKLVYVTPRPDGAP
jgi:hypothetical protein